MSTYGQYIPETHTGSKRKIIKGLIGEAIDIIHSGAMRLHAKDREITRIMHLLRQLGGDILDGTKEDKGYFIFLEKHEKNCPIHQDDEAECNCKGQKVATY